MKVSFCSRLSASNGKVERGQALSGCRTVDSAHSADNVGTDESVGELQKDESV